MYRLGTSLVRKMSFSAPKDPFLFNVVQNERQSLPIWLEKNLSNVKVIFFGEDHQESQVIGLQAQLIQHLVHEKVKVKVVMEHFDIEQQIILDKFCQNEIDLEKLFIKYQNSDEGMETKLEIIH